MSDRGTDNCSNGDTEGKIVFGRLAAPWTEEELSFLRSVAHQRCGKKMLAEAFPGRTIKAISKKLSDVRAELGIRKENPNLKKSTGAQMLNPGDPGLADGYMLRRQAAAAASNARFVAALQRVLA